MNHEVKHFLRSFTVVAILLIAVDICFGLLFDRAFLRLPRSDKMPSTICHRFIDRPQVMLIGSSRCHHHYDATLLADSIASIVGKQADVFNYGLDAIYVGSSLAVIESMLQRHTPDLIILDANSHEFDVVYRKTISVASPIYWSDDIMRHHINAAVWSNPLTMLSSLYRYRNAMPLRMAEAKFGGPPPLRGFVPLDDVLDTTKAYPPGPTTEELVVDSLVVGNFRHVARLCSEKNVRLLVVDSPRFRPTDNSNLVRQLCRECNIPFIDFYDTPFFNRRPELFYDPGHLNATGAHIFTSLLIDELRNHLAPLQ